MNLLDTVLCNCHCENYSNNFKKLGIDAFTLKLLNDEDLKIVGIQEEETRKAILKHATNLQIPSEKHVEVIIDDKYIIAVLAQMSVHLQRYFAALSIAAYRKDVVICNVKLYPATKCLKDCLHSLKEQLDKFENKMTVKRKKKDYKRFLVPGMAVTLIMVLSYKMTRYVLKI